MGQSLSVATQIGRPPRRGSTLILKLVMLSIQLGEDDDFVNPAKAERTAAASLAVAMSVADAQYGFPLLDSTRQRFRGLPTQHCCDGYPIIFRDCPCGNAAPR